MRTIYSILLLLSPLFLGAQDNLVLNPGFEKGDRGPGAYEKKGPDYLIDNWYIPVKGKPNLYVIPKKPVAKAASGTNAIGLVLGSGKHHKTDFEYITGKLSSPMVEGQKYCVCLQTILHRTSKWAGQNIGIVFHHDKKYVHQLKDPLSSSASIYLNEGKPVTNTIWNEYCGYYEASGGEQYITIGKFGSSESVEMESLGLDPYPLIDGFQGEAFYQFDDISVKALQDSADCGCAEDIIVTEDSDTIAPPPIPPFLFALDASGSMKKNGLFGRLRSSLTSLLGMLPEGTPVGFVTFASNARVLYSGTVDKNTVSQVDSMLSRQGLGGGTNVYFGLREAYGSWQAAGRDSARVILISDGAFTVTGKIVETVKNEFENKGRRLTVVQIDAKAKGMERLEPYQVEYIQTIPEEIDQIVTHLYEGQGTGGNAIACECIEAYSDTMNYHFVIDYSGSMGEEKSRAISALRYLYERAPDDAVISITSFNVTAKQLFVGRKSDMNIFELTAMLRRQPTGGGTDPAPGVENALRLAEKMAKDRYSHVVLITDLARWGLSVRGGLTDVIYDSKKKIDMSAAAISVSSDGLVTTYSEFDETQGKFVHISRSMFEKDLFHTAMSSCDYTTQPYHYNPAKEAFKNQSKKFFGFALKTIIESSIN